LLLSGALYLLLAACAGLYSLYSASTLRVKQTTGRDELAWALHNRAYVLLLSGWQAAILGLVNIWQFVPGSSVQVGLGYISVGVFIILSYRLVSAADNAKQEGGSRPLNYFGRPRSRRLFFGVFLSVPIVVLIDMNVRWSDAPWCPNLLRLPGLWLLFIALASAMSAVLILQRYRGVAGDRAWRNGLLVGTVVVLGCAWGIQVFLQHDMSICVLSSITLVSLTLTVYESLLAKEATTSAGREPHL